MLGRLCEQNALCHIREPWIDRSLDVLGCAKHLLSWHCLPKNALDNVEG